MEETDSRELPKIIYGTAWKEHGTAGFVKMAVEKGFRAIDTANQPRHYKEAFVGDALLELEKNGVGRDKLFLQSKFTPLSGQDHRVPYDRDADLTTQVNQSFNNSLENLHTEYLDSYLLHGPHYRSGLGDEDWEVWRAIEGLYKAGKVKMIGISNVDLDQLQQLFEGAEIKPMVVQIRCFATSGWDMGMRKFCKANNIVYEGFSLLTANPNVVGGQIVMDIAKRVGATPAQVVLRFSMQVGMIPLTGTTDQLHMINDLYLAKFDLNEDELKIIETLCI